MAYKIREQLDWFSFHSWRNNALAIVDAFVFFAIQIHLVDHWITHLFLPKRKNSLYHIEQNIRFQNETIPL